MLGIGDVDGATEEKYEENTWELTCRHFPSQPSTFDPPLLHLPTPEWGIGGKGKNSDASPKIRLFAWYLDSFSENSKFMKGSSVILDGITLNCPSLPVVTRYSANALANKNCQLNVYEKLPIQWEKSTCYACPSNDMMPWCIVWKMEKEAQAPIW